MLLVISETSVISHPPNCFFQTIWSFLVQYILRILIILVAYLYNFSICITHFEMEEQKCNVAFQIKAHHQFTVE